METTAPGGINKVVREIAKHLSKRHEITVLQSNPLNLPEREIYEGFEIIRINSRFADCLYGLSPEMHFYLKKHFKELAPDIVHVHGYHTLSSPEIIWTIRRVDAKIPIIFTPHYDPLNHSTTAGKLFGKLYDRVVGKYFLKRVNHIVSVSEFESDNLKAIFNIPERKITIIPHGVDFIDINKKRKDCNTIKLLYGGYLLDYKGVHFIIKALRELIYTYRRSNIYLKIIGEGPEKEKLITLSKKLKVEKFIEWIPFLPNKSVLEEMKKADVFLLLSKAEGYGIVVAESLAMGTPAIVTNGTALEEFTKEPGCFGIDYPPDPKEVARLILKIVDSDAKVGPFSNKIRTWNKTAEDYKKIYQELLEN